jgi:hypothetical protein
VDVFLKICARYKIQGTLRYRHGFYLKHSSLSLTFNEERKKDITLLYSYIASSKHLHNDQRRQNF